MKFSFMKTNITAMCGLEGKEPVARGCRDSSWAGTASPGRERCVRAG